MTLKLGGVRLDPPAAFNFLVTLQGSGGSVGGGASMPKPPAAGFSEAGGLEMNLEVEEYKEGGVNDRVRQFATRMSYSHIRLKRGMALSDELWEWIYAFVEGRGERKDGAVTLMDAEHKPVKAWEFIRGLPVKWSGPSLDANQSQVAFEELEIAHEGLRLGSSTTLMSPGELVDLGRDALGL